MSDHDHTTSVEYRDIPGFPGYRVGDDGTIWSQWWTRRGTTEWHRLKGSNINGYICLQKRDCNGVMRFFKLHRLILEIFVGPCPEGMECCHNDGNPSNNHVSNLRWDTHASNIRDAIKHGNFKNPARRGSRHHNAKLTEADIPVIRRLLIEGVSGKEIARRYKVAKKQIYSIKYGRTWSHVK